MTFRQATSQVKGFCLEVTNGELKLKKSHMYYYQCMCQLAVTQQPWVDFVVRTQSPYDIHIERLTLDRTWWNELVLPKLQACYEKVLLPELAAPREGKDPGIREPGIWVGRQKKNNGKSTVTAHTE